MLCSLLSVVWCGGFVCAAPIDMLPQVPPTCAEPVIDGTEASLAIQRAVRTRRSRGRVGSFEDSCAHGELPAHCACAGKKRPTARCASATKVKNGARGGCQEVCPAKGQPRPEADQRQTPAAPCVRELGGRKQGKYRSAHAESYGYVARETEGALVLDGGQRRQADAGAAPPQRHCSRRQPAVCLRPRERLRGAGNGFATVTRRSAKELRAPESVRPAARARVRE